MHHLRDGVYFGRDGDEVVIAVDCGALGRREIRVPFNEWASAVAATSRRGENGETFAEAIALLEGKA